MSLGEENKVAQPAGFRGKRFSIRTLFAISFFLIAPFLLVAMLSISAEGEKNAASPMFLFFGVIGLLGFAAVGSAVGSRPGLICAIAIGLAVWLGIFAVAYIASDPLIKNFPLHVLAMLGTVIGIGAALRFRRNDATLDSQPTIDRLMLAKQEVVKVTHKDIAEDSPRSGTRQSSGGAGES